MRNAPVRRRRSAPTCRAPGSSHPGARCGHRLGAVSHRQVDMPPAMKPGPRPMANPRAPRRSRFCSRRRIRASMTPSMSPRSSNRPPLRGHTKQARDPAQQRHGSGIGGDTIEFGEPGIQRHRRTTSTAAGPAGPCPAPEGCVCPRAPRHARSLKQYRPCREPGRLGVVA